MSQSKDVCKNTTMEDIASMPNNHRRTSDIMADYLEGRITFAAAKEENEAVTNAIPDTSSKILIPLVGSFSSIEELPRQWLVRLPSGCLIEKPVGSISQLEHAEDYIRSQRANIPISRSSSITANQTEQKENTVDKESNNREYTFTHVPSKEQEMTNTTTTKTGNLQQKDTSTKIIGSLGYPQENQDSYRYFGDHDFSTPLFDEHKDKPWPLINEFISKRVFRIFGQDCIWVTYAGIASDHVSVGKQPFEFFTALREQLSYRDLSTGNITINGGIIETLDFMLMMDALRGADEHMRIPPYSDIVKEQFWDEYVTHVYGAETVYDATPYRNTPGGPARKLAKLAALPRILHGLMGHDKYTGCRVNDYKNSEA